VCGVTATVWAVVPVFDERATLGRVVEALSQHCPVIVVDDASTDDSREVAARAGATEVLRHPRRAGKGAALRTGFTAALRRGATAIATLDGDGQHDPADLPGLLAAHRTTPDALVLGNRFGAGGGDPIPMVRRAAIRAADHALAPLVPTALSDSQCGFRVYPASFLRDVPLREERFVLETEALVRAVRAGYPLVSVPVRSVYPPGRRSRLHAVTDVARIAWYLGRAWLQDHGPVPVRSATVTSGPPLVGSPEIPAMASRRDVAVVSGGPTSATASS
jgi:glycosyltransferase involved in cell wall biosynthesis